MPKQHPYSLLSVLASGSWLTAERAKLYPLAFLTIQALAYLGLVLAGHGNLDAFGRPIGTDFASFWTSSRFVLAGNAAGAYDPYQHHAAQILLFTGQHLANISRFDRATYLAVVAFFAAIGVGAAIIAGGRALFDQPAAMLKKD